MGNQQRITEVLEQYWQAKKPESGIPSESDINPADLEDIWSSCFLVKDEGDERFRYLYMGEAIIEALGDDLTGREVCRKLVGDLHDPLVEKFAPVLTADSPQHDESSFVNRCRMNIKYRMCLLPLRGENKNSVSFILGGMKWKAY